MYNLSKVRKMQKQKKKYLRLLSLLTTVIVLVSCDDKTASTNKQNTLPVVCSSNQVLIGGVCVTPDNGNISSEFVAQPECDSEQEFINGVCVTPDKEECDSKHVLIDGNCVAEISPNPEEPDEFNLSFTDRITQIIDPQNCLASRNPQFYFAPGRAVEDFPVRHAIHHSEADKITRHLFVVKTKGARFK